MALRHDEQRPVWNPTPAQVAIDYGFTVELCTPHRARLVGADVLIAKLSQAASRGRLDGALKPSVHPHRARDQ